MTQISTWSGPTAPGTTIGGRYTVRTVVGHGGMGTVWQATDTVLNRDVAVKEVVPPPTMALSDRHAMYERTLREARAAACLSHPSVVQVYDVVTEHGRPWIVMELLEARSLADHIVDDGPLAPRAVAKIGIALLGALEVAHAAGILHRDVKPANVLIAVDGRCVLTDFGVAHLHDAAQLTTPGMVLGSPHFISPERAIGHAFGPPSDLFSLGVTLYTAVEGRPPFDRGDPIETMHAVVEDAPARALRAGPLAEVLMALLEKDPYRRLDTVTARSMLRELLAGPLASVAPGHVVTDPYAIVPAQRVTAVPRPTAAAPGPTGQIGGRAMLAPGESLTDRLARLRAGQESAEAAAAGRHRPTAPVDVRAATDDLAATGAPTAAQATVGDRRGPLPPSPWSAGSAATTPLPAVVRPPTLGPADDSPTAALGSRSTADGSPPAHGTPPAGGAASAAGAGSRAMALRGALRGRATRAQATVAAWPRQTRIAAGAGLAALAFLGAVVAANSGDDNYLPARALAPAEPAADFPTQRHSARGVSVNVPRGWQRASAGSWVDFADPADGQRKVRILVEPASAEPLRFIRIAESGLRRADTCAQPYQQVGLRRVELDGRPAAELEYTCGAGDGMRHGVWRAVVAEGRAYSFYLTADESRFTESRSIFDEMVRSFRLAA
ncbi:protein kinase domain-containing protein [Pilimelia columellifera]|uniref:non-specific serine/threonine protein kinase n=1 Tax=Pilimelia columellifera subsp. columellifera TaxID=706583 RepID=A0ABN3NJC4_9ACTN